jgi:hypothetical protein
MDGFADRVAVAVRDGGPEDFLERPFAFVERLAATRERRWENLVLASWRRRRGVAWARSPEWAETLRVLSRAKPMTIDPELL